MSKKVFLIVTHKFPSKLLIYCRVSEVMTKNTTKCTNQTLSKIRN